MFKFFKIRTSDFGDARRHVPFASIIHKHVLPLFVSLLFCFVMVVPVKVSALADPVPQFNSISDTDITTFIGGYNAASQDVQWITNALIGSQVFEYSGLGSYKARFEQLGSDADVWDRLVLVGEKVTDDLMAPYVAADRSFSKIIDFATGALNFAKSFASKTAFLSHVNSVQNFYLEYSPEFGSQLNQFFAVQGGLYDWQFQPMSIDQFGSFTFKTASMTSSLSAEYSQYYSQYIAPYPHIQCNSASSLYNYYVVPSVSDMSFLAEFHNLCLFNGYAYLYNDSGVSNDSHHFTFSTNLFHNNYMVFVNNVYSNNSYLGYATYDQSLTYAQILNNIFTSFSPLFNSSSNYLAFDLRPFIQHVYYGSNWANRIELNLASDLGFSDTDSMQVLNPLPGSDMLFDVKGMVEQIVEADPDPALELPMQPIIYNITQVNGDPLSAQDLEGLSFNVKPTQSGIDFSPDVFLPMFNGGSGFISYMWYMTKPLVLFTRDLLDSLTFDPVNGFSASGPGYFILGVAGLGVIGGVIVKFLL